MNKVGVSEDSGNTITGNMDVPAPPHAAATEPDRPAAPRGYAGLSSSPNGVHPGYRRGLTYPYTPGPSPQFYAQHSGAIRVELDFATSDYRHRPYTMEMIPGHDFTHLYPLPPLPSVPSVPLGSSPPSVLHHNMIPMHATFPLQANMSDPYQQGVQIRKQRRTQACDWCHKKRIKCDGGRPCNNCTKRDVRCEWRTMKRRGPKPKVARPQQSATRVTAYGKGTKKPSAADISNLLVDDDVVRTSRLYASGRRSSSEQKSMSETDTTRHSPSSEDDVDTSGFVRPPTGNLLQEFYSDKVDAETRDAVLAYFDYFYPNMSVFHPSTFLRRVVTNDVHPLLIEALKCMVAPFIAVRNKTTLDTDNLAADLKAKILFSLEQPTTDIVLALIFLAATEVVVSRTDTYAVLMSAIIGMIMRLGYHEIDLYKNGKPKAWDEWIQVETKRRIFWMIFQHDSFMSLIHGLPTMIPESSIFVKSPCADSDWNDIEFPLIYSTEGDTPVSERLSEMLGSNLKRSSSYELSPELEVPDSVVTGAVSHSFALLCEFNTLDSRMCRFLGDAKAARFDQDDTELQSRPFPSVDFLEPVADSEQLVYSVKRKTRLVSEYPMFRQFDAQLRDLHERVKPPKHLSEFAYNEDSIQRFGSAEYGLAVMRVRYVIITAFTCSSTVILHSNNRASFFTEFEQPEEAQTDPSAAALKQVMAAMFGKVWSQGLLATDIEPDSWATCVMSSHTLAEYLRRNQDIPSIRVEKMVCISIIITSSVLLRQIRRCKAALKEADDSEMTLSQWQQELDRSLQDVRSMWEALLKLSEAWNLDGIAQVLKMMDTDDAINTADQLSSLSL